MNVGKFTNQQLSEGINVLSLFDGMGGIWEVLQDMGVKVKNAYSSEIDKFANLANHHAHPYVQALGDVRGVRAADLPKIDLIVGGSPCQGFSFAGKQLKFDDPRSVLFFEFVRILEECRKANPDILFFLENVRMDKKSENVISRILGIAPIFIDSQLVCAQMRKRNYWTNIGIVQRGFFDDFVPGIPQPKDRGIFLKDILQPAEEVDPKYHLSPTAMKRLGIRMESNYGKPRFFLAKYGALTTRSNNGQCNMDSGMTLVPVGCVIKDEKLRHIDKSTCLVANYYKGIDNHAERTFVMQQTIADNQDVIIQRPRGKNEGGLFQEKCPTVTANHFEQNHTVRQMGCLKFGRTPEAKEHRRVSMAHGKDHTPFQGKQINGLDFEKCNTLTTALSKDTVLSDNDYMVFRRLTPVECCRLQGVRDDFFLDKDGKQFVSDTQAYKMLGNGWQLDTIKYLLEFSI